MLTDKKLPLNISHLVLQIFLPLCQSSIQISYSGFNHNVTAVHIQTSNITFLRSKDSHALISYLKYFQLHANFTSNSII